jgi:predicted RNase H-like nuclease (RuvC/YqgF family)
MDFHLGIEGTNSNGHGDERNENMNMEETIKNLQKDVQNHKSENESLMKSKEQQDDFKTKLMQSLNIIEKKLDKESGSSKFGSHRPPDEKRRTISVTIHRHHSPMNSNKRAHNKSSPSPVRKHKGSGVDDLQREMNKLKPPTFDGEHKKDEDAKTWLLGMRKYFQLHNYSSHFRR